MNLWLCAEFRFFLFLGLWWMRATRAQRTVAVRVLVSLLATHRCEATLVHERGGVERRERERRGNLWIDSIQFIQGSHSGFQGFAGFASLYVI